MNFVKPSYWLGSSKTEPCVLIFINVKAFFFDSIISLCGNIRILFGQHMSELSSIVKFVVFEIS